MRKESRWEIRFISSRNGWKTTEIAYSDQEKDRMLRKLSESGEQVLRCRKLYPFSTMHYGHHFGMQYFRCSLRIDEIESGQPEKYSGEKEYLMGIAKRAQEFERLPFPVAWLPFDELRDAKQIVEMSIKCSKQACIDNGFPEQAVLYDY